MKYYRTLVLRMRTKTRNSISAFQNFRSLSILLKNPIRHFWAKLSANTYLWKAKRKFTPKLAKYQSNISYPSKKNDRVFSMSQTEIYGLAVSSSILATSRTDTRRFILFSKWKEYSTNMLQYQYTVNEICSEYSTIIPTNGHFIKPKQREGEGMPKKKASSHATHKSCWNILKIFLAKNMLGILFRHCNCRGDVSRIL